MSISRDAFRSKKYPFIQKKNDILHSKSKSSVNLIISST